MKKEVKKANSHFDFVVRNNLLSKSKYSQAGIIVTVLLILLVLGAVVIVWNIVVPLVRESSGQIGDIGILSVQGSVVKGSVFINYSSEKLQLSILRGADNSNLSGFKIIIEDENRESRSYFAGPDENMECYPTPLETKTCSYDIKGLANITKISVYPVFVSGKIGMEKKHEIKGSEEGEVDDDLWLVYQEGDEGEPEICSDGVDNDHDNLIDCEDSEDCALDPGWYAYVDLYGGSAGNVSTYSLEPGFPDSGVLRKYSNNGILNVNFELTSDEPWTSGSWNNGGSGYTAATSGTDADKIFSNKADTSGVLTYYHPTAGDHDWYHFNFTDLNPNRKYRFVHFGNRNQVAYTDRKSRVILSGADSFTANSSSGVVKSTTNIASDTATYVTGYNYVNGYVAAWTDIDPGNDGEIFVEVTGVAEGNPYKHYSNVLLLQQLPMCKPNENFTIIVLPDTQNYVTSSARAAIFTNQTEWIVANKDKLNIKFVIHEGDIVSDPYNPAQWDYADASLIVLDDNDIPYSVVPGNHEHTSSDDPTSSVHSNYNNYFPWWRYAGKPWYGGRYSGYSNNFQKMTIGEEKYIFISIDWCPASDELDWMNGVLNTYPDRKAIITTHSYLDDAANTTQSGNSRCNRYGTGNTTYIWNQIKQHKNAQIVLCGHEHDGPSNNDGEEKRTDLNDYGLPVYQMLANYQGYSNGGNGYLRILEFAPAEDKIYVKTYSPYLDSYRTGYKSQFVLDYEMD